MPPTLSLTVFPVPDARSHVANLRAMLNIHHLELFYYVAIHGGISEAVRHMPYGIQQPAISGQMISLEENLGQTLFRRRPFKLTPAGEDLLHFVRPFFDNLERVENRLRGNAGRLLRIAASSTVLKSHLPEVLQQLQTRFDGLRFNLHEALQPDVANLMQRREVDCAITVLSGPCGPGIQSSHLIELPLVLLVPTKSKIKSADDLWHLDRIAEPLIALPEQEPISKHFAAGLQQRSISWPVSFEVSSLDLIETYTADGFGFGVTVDVPNQPPRKGVRALPLDGFEPIQVAVLWAGPSDPVIETLVTALKTYASQIRKKEPATASASTPSAHPTL